MKSVGLVVFFWWAATGVIIAMQFNAATRFAGVVVATILAVVGVLELHAVRHDTTPAGVRRAFLGGAMLWGWVSATFYGGFLTGIHPVTAVATAPAWSAVLPAIAATLVSDSAALVIMIFGAVMDRGATNRTGFRSFMLFWAVQQVAKLNVFFGVENPAANFLPPHLGYLRQFFGPPVDSPFLPVSLAVVAAATVWAAWGMRPSRDSGARATAAIYATILALAVLELALLGVRLESTPWDSFLRARGG